QLHLDRNRKILVFRHRLRRLAVEHQAVVAQGPCRSAFRLLPHKPVLSRKNVMRELLTIKETAKLVVKRFVLIVANLEDTIFDPERFPEVFTERKSRNLRNPSIQILAVKKLNPFLGVGLGLAEARRSKYCCQKQRDRRFHASYITTCRSGY